MDIIQFLKENAVMVGVILPLVAMAITAVAGLFKFGQYVNVQRSKQKQVEYTNYHSLVERLTAPLPGSSNAWLDIQRAAVFELRNYPKYKDVTHEILSGWIQRGTKLESTMKETLQELDRPYEGWASLAFAIINPCPKS